jgi:hypothetical protein
MPLIARIGFAAPCSGEKADRFLGFVPKIANSVAAHLSALADRCRAMGFVFAAPNPATSR